MKIAKITSFKSPVTATVNVPGSKSYSLRALFIAALCDKDVKLDNLLDSADVSAMQSCLQAIKAKRIDVEAEESGLTARFMTALACITPGAQIITGKPGLLKRPIRDLVDALRSLGADIQYMDQEGFLPLKVKSSDLSGSEVRLSGAISSQYLSALLLIAPRLPNGLQITVEGEQISKPYIDMTIDIMKKFGASVKNENYKQYIVAPQPYVATPYTVECDYSSASYFFAINTLTGSQIAVAGLNPASKQGDKKFVEVIKNWNGQIKPIDINARDFPDQAMTLAVLLAFAPGQSIISGVKSLRVKETERVKALENELAKMGISTQSTHDSLTIYGGEPRSARIDTYGDHRIAMAFAVAGCKLLGIEIMKPEVVNKTFPGFWDELGKITEVEIAEKSYSNIILIGMRGTGKSTVGKILAQRTGKEFIDLDKYIESKHNLNIKQTVQEKGWEYFRDLETKAIEDLLTRENIILSTGGGAILRPQNVAMLRQLGLVFMLKAKPATLARRISAYGKLPALTNHTSIHAELKTVWKERKNSYLTSCDFIINTEKLYPQTVAEQIIGKIDA